MGGGSAGGSQSANGAVAFNPTSIGGGNIMVGGSVGQGQISQGQSTSATGASVGLDFKMDMPIPGMGGELLLINLDQL